MINKKEKKQKRKANRRMKVLATSLMRRMMRPRGGAS